MVNNKLIPNKFTSKFKTGKGLMKPDQRKHRHKSIQEGMLSEQIFSVSDMPILPQPSNSLRELLLEYNRLNETSTNNSSPKKPSSPRKNNKIFKMKNINGFIAFRSFYSRLISNPDHQRELSVLLGRLWEKEPSKAVWTRYATEYNVSLKTSPSSTLPFVDWLCQTLNLDTQEPESCTSTVRNSNWTFSSKNDLNMVEDVYLVW